MAWYHVHRHLKSAFIPHAGNNYHPHAVRHRMLGIYAVLLVALKLGTVAFVSFSTQPARLSEITSTNIIRLSNNERRAGKITVLKSNATLAKAAQAKANDMLRQQYFAHISPSNITPWYWFKQAGYRYQYAGENLAIDFVESEDVVKAWMNSPSHRKNLMNPKFKDIGVAVVSGNFQGANSIIVVQMFGTPTPQATRRVASGPVQQPAPTNVKTALAQAAPTVLGETEETPEPPVDVPPVAPTIRTPAPSSLVRTGQPEVVGTAEAGSHVSLQMNDQTVAQADVPADGIYSLQPATALADADYRLSVVSEARGLSTMSLIQNVTVDTKAPEVMTDSSYAVLSLVGTDTYDVHVVTTPDAISVRAPGNTELARAADGTSYDGRVTLAGDQSASGVLRLSVEDAAGNQTNVALADTNLFTTGVVAATEGPIVSALRAIAFSRMIMSIFLVVMLSLAMLNFFVHLRHQHHQTILASLLVIYLAGSLLLL